MMTEDPTPKVPRVVDGPKPRAPRAPLTDQQKANLKAKREAAKETKTRLEANAVFLAGSDTEEETPSTLGGSSTDVTPPAPFRRVRKQELSSEDD
jgi:hypothetical protein